MKLTFLEGYKPLVKRFTSQGVDSYPQVKKVTSHTFEIENDPPGLREKYKLVQKHAAAGCGLLKGSLIRDLVKESRAGMTSDEAPAYNIVMDIDGVRPIDLEMGAPFNADKIRTLSEYFVAWLPACFHRASYIVHASASLGTKPGVFSIHLDFLLKTPIPVQILKDYLTWLNFALPQFEQELTLTATGTALRYKLDRTLADNSRIIYIGHPVFEEVDDPIPNTDDRLMLVEKMHHCVDLAEEIKAMDAGKIQRLTRAKITYLRQSAGLPESKEHRTTARINGHMISVVTNPDNMYLTLSYEKGPFVYYNINGGDSNAYFVYKNNPQVVYNFKGEPNFLFERADPETYKKHLEMFGFGNTPGNAPATETEDTEEKAEALTIPLVFRDKGTDRFYNAMFNTGINELVEVNSVSGEKGCLSWMKEHNGIPPEIIPSVDYVFAPNDERRIDLSGRFINRFIPSELMLNPAEIDDKYKGTTYGYAGNMAELCPTIHKLTNSICGNGQLEVEHFINWLAFLVQEKDKTQTAWLFHGVQGTGKGVFLYNVLMPIVGENNAVARGVGDIEEQYNSWLQETLLVAFDEFSIQHMKNKTKIADKLKNWITDKLTSVRAMHTDYKTPRTYCSFLFFTNHEAPITLDSSDDRRYNVAPRQLTPLREQYPEIIDDLIPNLEKETPLFATYLLNFKYVLKMVRVPLANNAKEELRLAGRTTNDEFCDAVRAGNFEYFLEILNVDSGQNFHDYILPAKNLLQSYIRKLYADENPATYVKDLRVFYEAIVGPVKSDAVLGKMLSRKGLSSTRQLRNGNKIAVYDIKWDVGDINLKALMHYHGINPTAAPSHIRAAAAASGS